LLLISRKLSFIHAKLSRKSTFTSYGNIEERESPAPPDEEITITHKNSLKTPNTNVPDVISTATNVPDVISTTTNVSDVISTATNVPDVISTATNVPDVSSAPDVNEQIKKTPHVKTVKWSDIVSTTPPTTAPSPAANKAKSAPNKVYKKTPKVVKRPAPKIPRKSAISQPRTEPFAGKKWKGFCGNPDHECVYTFRDNHAVDEDSGAISTDSVVDQTRFDCGRIYNNQLYLRGWNSEITRYMNMSF
jgi:hypothetical protein